MNYSIIGFGAYMITDERQVIKIAHTPKGQKVSVISPFRPHANSEYEYVRLTKKENGVTTRYTFPIDEIFVSAKLGLELGTPESRSSMKKYRHERELMGRVSSAVGDTLKEQEIVNLLHADLVRQMRNVGLIVDTDNLTVFVVSQILFDYLRICCESSKTPVTQKVITKNGESLQEHPIWQMKRKFFAEVLSGLRSLGLTYERVIKQIPTEIIDDINTMFEKKEHDDKTKDSGIVWVE